MVAAPLLGSLDHRTHDQRVIGENYPWKSGYGIIVNRNVNSVPNWGRYSYAMYLHVVSGPRFKRDWLGARFVIGAA